MEAINEVKKIEIDLDRATIQCSDLNKKIILEKDQQKVYKLKLFLFHNIWRKRWIKYKIA